MPVEPQKTTVAAINEVTEADLDTAATGAEGDEGGEGESTAEGTAEGEAEGEAAGEEEAAEGEEGEEGEEEGEEEDEETEGEEGEEAEGEEGAEALLDEITPEQLKAIKANPETHALYKALMKATTKKWQNAAEAVKLVDAYRRDPVGVLQAIARANNMEVKQAAAPADTPDPMQVAGQEIEQVFGPKFGPQMRQIFERFVDARLGKTVAPLQTTLTRVVTQGEAARMMSEEQAFKMRHREVLNPEVEKEIIKLGESGEYVPGPNTTPSQYLETLLTIVLSKRAMKDAAGVRRKAAVNLRDRIRKNQKEREPSGVGAKAGVGKKSAVRPDMSLSEAFEVAARELDEEGVV